MYDKFSSLSIIPVFVVEIFKVKFFVDLASNISRVVFLIKFSLDEISMSVMFVDPKLNNSIIFSISSFAVKFNSIMKGSYFRSRFSLINPFVGFNCEKIVGTWKVLYDSRIILEIPSSKLTCNSFDSPTDKLNVESEYFIVKSWSPLFDNFNVEIFFVE